MMRALLLILFALCAIAAEDKKKLPTGRADLATGKKLFENHCGLCHGPAGEGGRGPMLAKARLSRAPDDAALINVVSHGIRGTEMPGADSMSEREVRQTAAYVRSLGKVNAVPVPGNVALGAEIYRGKGGCVNCHAINGEGGVSGPGLSGIGGKRSAAYLKEALLNPDSALPDGYMQVAATPKSGAKVTGRRVNEDSFSIQLIDNAGRLHSFWKSELADLNKQRGKSPMPSYKAMLSETELTDLIAFLASLKEDK
jgi:cytochrome c oxidase cbb3-type subunit III